MFWIVIIIIIGICYYLGKDSSPSTKYQAGTLLMLGDKTADNKLDEIELKQVSMRLNPKESCYYEGVGKAYNSKDIVTGYDRTSNGYSVSPMKGLSIHNSTGKSTAIRKTVTKEYPGRLFFTNHRIVFLAERYGFDIDLDNLSNITMYNDYMEIFSGSKFYRVFSDDCVYIRDLIVLMNMAFEEQQEKRKQSSFIPQTKKELPKSTEETTTAPVKQNFSTCENAISNLWNNGSETAWKEALEHYYNFQDADAVDLDRYMEKVNPDNVAQLSADEFYNFLHDKYFVWKYTAKNRLATTRKYLRRYVEENNLSELADIQKRLFLSDRSNIGKCMSIATEIRGLGPAGASGLLSILFPESFGTVDQFVVKALREVEGFSYANELAKMNPESLSMDNSVLLIRILREKANELNQRFDTDFWTPRKIDMVLWSIGR